MSSSRLSSPKGESAALSRRRLLARVGNLGFAGLASLLTAGCAAPIKIRTPDLSAVVRDVVGQAQQATGSAPPPKVLQWFTRIPPPSQMLQSSPTGSPSWNEAMGWAQILDRWKAAHPAITLVHRVVSAADMTQQEIAASTAGEPCDVAYTDWGRALGEANVLDPLDVSLLARKIVSVAFAPHTFRDQIYAFPVFLSCLGLYRNHQRFQAAELSVDAPLRDWSTFETAARKLTDRAHQSFGFDVFGSGSPLSGQMRYGPFLWSAGGTFFDDAGEKATWNQPAGLSAIIYLARLAQNYASPGAAAAQDSVLVDRWLSGQTAMLLFGPELTVEADQKGVVYSVQSVPAYIQEQSSSLVMSAGAVGIFAKSRHKDWALDFVHYLAGKDAQVAGLAYLRLLPANVEAGDAAPVFQHNQPMGQFLRILREDDVHPFPMARSRNADIQKIFRAYLGVALQGLATPELAWNKSADEATTLLRASLTPTPTPRS
jgi:ABC-type glycerol-3-phosphate transport system substrate-binding protein